jgi:hypothetical protein
VLAVGLGGRWLTKEITYWDHRAEELKLQVSAGKSNAEFNSGEARKCAELLQGRLQDLKLEAQLSPLPPVVLGGLLVVPIGLIRAMTGQTGTEPTHPIDTQASVARARAIVMAVERGLGFDPTGREFEKLGYDIESRVPGTGKLRFIEVKGRVSGAETITVTRNEMLYSLIQVRRFHPRHGGVSRGRHTPSALPSTTVSAGAGLPCRQRELRLR